MLSPRAVALQGIGFSPLLVGLQGLVEEAVVSARRPRRGARFEPYKPQVVPYNLAELHRDDELVTDLLVGLVTKGFFDGTS